MSDFVCVMHKGVIQQSDTPWAIYHQPANRFVASFVGANNFLPVTENNGNVSFCGVTTTIAAAGIGQPSPEGIVVSVRPERITLTVGDSPSTESAAQIVFPAVVDFHSFAGRELRMTVTARDGTSLQIISDPREEFVSLTEGAAVGICINKEDLGFYQADEMGARL